MIDAFLSAVASWPPSLVIVVMAALPVLEVRLAVPVALEVFNMPVFAGAFFAFIGSVIPAFFIPTLLHWFEGPCRRHIPVCARALDWSAVHVERRYTKRYRALGILGLVLFVAVPIPMTGVWTGSLAAWLFRMKKRYVIPAIMIGSAISTVIVTLMTLGFFSAVRQLF